MRLMRTGRGVFDLTDCWSFFRLSDHLRTNSVPTQYDVNLQGHVVGLNSVNTFVLAPRKVSSFLALYHYPLNASKIHQDNANVRLKGKFSNNEIHCRNAGHLPENATRKEIPTLILSNILCKNAEEEPDASTTTSGGTVDHGEDCGSRAMQTPEKSCKENLSPTNVVEPEKNTSLVPWKSNVSLRNKLAQKGPLCSQVKQSEYDFKETYQRLKKLGLLKARLENCHVGMTSPSGKYKFEAQKSTNHRSISNLLQPKKTPARINSKYLQNNAVLKVKHFYESQGKQLPEELLTLTRGRALQVATIPSGSIKKTQLYPRTSPSTKPFAKIKK